MAILLTMSAPVWAEKPVAPPRVLYIPLDNRPITDKQTAEVLGKLGYEVQVPPDELLGSRSQKGDPEKLWKWLEDNAREATAAVVSTDSVIYGSLLESRNHNLGNQQLLNRAEKFKNFHSKFPKLTLYAFSSIMRTPRNGDGSGHEEPEYYQSYGSDIFRYTALNDKASSGNLSPREKKEHAFLGKLIPHQYLDDWMQRRNKNFAVNQYLLKLSRDGVFNCFVLGRDDNAPYCQTHFEGTKLKAEAKGISASKFQTLEGVDEIGLLLLARAANANDNQVPRVFVRYNWGRGPLTVPDYSDEKISQSITNAISIAGGMQVPDIHRADLVLAVNTNPSGRTYEASSRDNTAGSGEAAEYFADIVKGYIGAGHQVAVADVSHANGADNAMMEYLCEYGLLYRLCAYSGWNTPTNSTGFAIAAGMLTIRMDREAVDDLLTTRYLDDWGYQANVRGIVARQLNWFRGSGVYNVLGTKQEYAQGRAENLLTHFAKENLAPVADNAKITVEFPWGRMFEADISHS